MLGSSSRFRPDDLAETRRPAAGWIPHPPGVAPKLNKRYIGLARGGVADNFVLLRAQKDALLAAFRIPRSDEVGAMIEDSGIDSLTYNPQAGGYRVRLGAGDVATYRDLLTELIRRASGTPTPSGEHEEAH